MQLGYLGTFSVGISGPNAIKRKAINATNLEVTDVYFRPRKKTHWRYQQKSQIRKHSPQTSFDRIFGHWDWSIANRLFQRPFLHRSSGIRKSVWIDTYYRRATHQRVVQWKISSTWARRSTQQQHLFSHAGEFPHGPHTADTEWRDRRSGRSTFHNTLTMRKIMPFRGPGNGP